MYTAADVAKYIVSYSTEQGKPISNLKLQKMLYYLWVDYYRLTGRELYADDICAWQFGPVVPEVYYEFCSYAGTPISKRFISPIGANDELILNEIINRYLAKAAHTLVDMTHKQGSPWNTVYQDGGGIREVIPFELIKRLECGN